jgi:hypothetical protein
MFISFTNKLPIIYQLSKLPYFKIRRVNRGKKIQLFELEVACNDPKVGK